MNALRLTGFVPAVLVLMCTTAEAQNRNDSMEQGFWAGVGLGAGWNTNANFAGGGRGGLGLYVRLGGTLSERLRLGGEALTWMNVETTTTPTSVNATTRVRANFTATAMVYPFRRGVYLKGGLGLAKLLDAFASGFSAGTGSQTGFGSTWGIGYEIRLGRIFHLTPAVNLMTQTFEANGTETTESAAVFTLGATWHR